MDCALPEEEMLRLEADINGPLLAEEASRLGVLKGDVDADAGPASALLRVNHYDALEPAEAKLGRILNPEHVTVDPNFRIRITVGQGKHYGFRVADATSIKKDAENRHIMRMVDQATKKLIIEEKKVRWQRGALLDPVGTARSLKTDQKGPCVLSIGMLLTAMLKKQYNVAPPVRSVSSAICACATLVLTRSHSLGQR
ncbi:hypothetical protein K466DRAFT_586644 [Polyporus arcularius HHB13444]|uniref:Uncharacterized protein n=1 Tax=Polyporus arcularius HHB13444 TaxID=1314778 RepID=A0A5C3PDP6_9APHY|nr:hypothetical protein K466DRAFT_586644 [Polyporus arcularius HHB13444]